MFRGLAKFCQLFIDAIVAVGNIISYLFPASPFTFAANSQFNDLISKINYFIPVYEFVAMAELWLVAIGLYYVISIPARWAKQIE